MFAEGAADFLLAQPPRRQRKIMNLLRQLAADPFVRSDYAVPDDSGRSLEHLLLDDYVFAYWLDHAVHEIRVVDIEDAS